MPKISPVREGKTAKQVTGNATKLKKLGELKKVSKQIDRLFKPDRAREKKMDKLFKKKDKLRQQLGID